MNQPSQKAILGQTLVVIGGSAGIGLESARQARLEGANVILIARNPDRLAEAAAEMGAERTVSLDANDEFALASFCRAVEHQSTT